MTLAARAAPRPLSLGSQSIPPPIFIVEVEARLAKREELKLRKLAEGSNEIDWDAEKQELYERLCRATSVQVTAQPNE
jgi:RNA-binding protein YhbY